MHRPSNIKAEPGSENVPFESEPGLRLVPLEESMPTDFMNPHAEMVRTERRQALARAFGNLTEKNQQLLTLRFGLLGEPETQASTARIMGVTRQNAQQMEVRALRALGRLLRPDFLEEEVS